MHHRWRWLCNLPTLIAPCANFENKSHPLSRGPKIMKFTLEETLYSSNQTYVVVHGRPPFSLVPAFLQVVNCIMSFGIGMSVFCIKRKKKRMYVFGACNNCKSRTKRMKGSEVKWWLACRFMERTLNCKKLCPWVGHFFFG